MAACFKFLGIALSLSLVSACTSNGFSSATPHAASADDTTNASIDQRSNGKGGSPGVDQDSSGAGGAGTDNQVVYVPVGGSKPVFQNDLAGSQCTTANQSIATCANGSVNGASVGSTTVTAGGKTVTVVVYNPANPPSAADLGSSGTGGGIDGVSNGLNPPNTALLGSSGQLLSCPPNSQHILILDFKSGWWAGDGGNFFQQILNALNSSCNGSVSIEYHHIIINGGNGPGMTGVMNVLTGSAPSSSSNGISNTMELFPGSGSPTSGGTTLQTAFQDPTFASYTQIWVLSGSSADPEDLPVSNSFFEQVLQAATATKAAFLIGCGYGSISHANAFAQSLGVGANLSTALPEGQILSPTDGIQVASTISSSSLQPSVLFSNGVTNLPDNMVIGGQPANGDAINSQGGVNIIAVDGHGQNTLAVSNQGRRVVMDSDLPRYYSIWQNESPTALQLLKNIVVYLSKETN